MTLLERLGHMGPALIEYAAQATPWIVGVGILGAMVYFSPLGREILRHVRNRSQEAALSETMIAELSDTRALLGRTQHHAFRPRE